MRAAIAAFVIAVTPAAARADRDALIFEASLEAAFIGTVLLDWQQTRWALANGHYERNPILGKYPSRAKVNAAAFGAIAAHGAISYLTPRRYRWMWQYVTFVAEGGVVLQNSFEVGFHFRF